MHTTVCIRLAYVEWEKPSLIKQLLWDHEFVFEAVLISVCFIECSDVTEKWGR
jgi:hypothetical protein